MPHGHRRTSTPIAALSPDGITAPFVFDHTLDGDLFRRHVGRRLAPALRRGDTVIMDSLATHAVIGIRTMIEDCGAGPLCLPSCSPGLDPIEPVFARPRQRLRSIAARTVDSLRTATGTCLETFSPDRRKRHIRHAGYGQTM